MMRLAVTGTGVWGHGLMGMDSVSSCLAGAELDASRFSAPRPEAIPTRERRRAGVMINLAVQVAHEACERAGVDKQRVPSVFASAMSDTAVTDYMCAKLSTPEKLLSPTRFHNSVHNAASGYWTISAANRAPSTFVGGFDRTPGAALLEAASQAVAFGGPVLLVCYDIAVGAPFDALIEVPETLAVALVLAPAVQGQPAWDVACVPAAGEQTSMPRHAWLRERARANPAGALLALVEAVERSGETQPDLYFPASRGLSMRFRAV